MVTDFSNEFNDAVIEAQKFNRDDILAFGRNYFECGYSGQCYYNHAVAVAIAIIGKLYGSSKSKGSNYHKGIAYIAKEVNLSKRQIKALRKKMLWRRGYVYKTSYKIHEIISKIIDLLDAKKTEPILIQFLKQQANDMYREILIAEQYAAIRAAARWDRKVNGVRGELEKLTKRVR